MGLHLLSKRSDDTTTTAREERERWFHAARLQVGRYVGGDCGDTLQRRNEQLDAPPLAPRQPTGQQSFVLDVGRGSGAANSEGPGTNLFAWCRGYKVLSGADSNNSGIATKTTHFMFCFFMRTTEVNHY